MNGIISIRDHISESLRKAGSHLSRHVFPVYACGEKNGRPYFIASCFFINVDDRCFLVSASHVYDVAKKLKSPVYVGIGNSVSRIPQAHAYRTVNTQGFADDIDVLAIPIDNKFDKYELALSVSVAINKTLMGRNFKNAHLKLVQGYPESRNKTQKSLNALDSNVRTTLLTSGHEFFGEINFSAFGKSPETHFALKWEKATGQNIPSSPKGMSGGPLWIIPNSLEPHSAFLAGVFIEVHHRESVAFVTKMSSVVDLIDKFGSTPSLP